MLEWCCLWWLQSKIISDTGLRIGQVCRYEPVAGFGFQVRPLTFGLGRTVPGDIVLAVAASAVGELGLDLAQQGLVGVAQILAALPGTIQAENRWSRLKTEVLEDRDWSVFADLVDAQVSVAEYSDCDRRHSSISYQKPYQLHQQ